MSKNRIPMDEHAVDKSNDILPGAINLLEISSTDPDYSPFYELLSGSDVTFYEQDALDFYRQMHEHSVPKEKHQPLDSYVHRGNVPVWTCAPFSGGTWLYFYR